MGKALRTDEYMQVVTTVGKRSDGAATSRALVERRLAACAQVVQKVLAG